MNSAAQQRLRALYELDARQHIVRAAAPVLPPPPPWLHLVRTPRGNAWSLGAQVPEPLAVALQPMCAAEPPAAPPAAWPQQRDALLRACRQYEPHLIVVGGPAYRAASVVDVQADPDDHVGVDLQAATGEPAPCDAIAVHADNAEVLRAHMADWLPDAAAGVPLAAVLLDGHAVSVCASVRIAAGRHEAGVETLPSARGAGRARAAVTAWQRLVQQAGARPMYSTSWDNIASQRVAAACGFQQFAVDFSVRPAG